MKIIRRNTDTNDKAKNTHKDSTNTVILKNAGAVAGATVLVNRFVPTKTQPVPLPVGNVIAQKETQEAMPGLVRGTFALARGVVSKIVGK